jgi:hypothetical protein
VDQSLDPEPLAYESLGCEEMMINKAKVYCGVYKFQGNWFSANDVRTIYSFYRHCKGGK